MYETFYCTVFFDFNINVSYEVKKCVLADGKWSLGRTKTMGMQSIVQEEGN
jgi:hypothetical protein